VDFREAHHLPSRGAPRPRGLPRQRAGTTPQRHGRYPDYDVLSQADHWDEVTRRLVLDRVERVPELRFFDEREAATLTVLCDLLLAQDEDPRVPVLAYVDEKLHEGTGDGYRYFDLPPDGETWRRVARGLDEEARRLGRPSFADVDAVQGPDVCHRFSCGDLHGGAWETLNVSRAFEVVMRDVCQAFFSHPWEWNEMGFGGPAYPRGYAAFGSPHTGEREGWERPEAFELDPVKDTQARDLD
jgi:Gluconate 2-dehydrogenase subunit 3